jgi:hypothetical protein
VWRGFVVLLLEAGKVQMGTRVDDVAIAVCNAVETREILRLDWDGEMEGENVRTVCRVVSR